MGETDEEIAAIALAMATSIMIKPSDTHYLKKIAWNRSADYKLFADWKKASGWRVCSRHESVRGPGSW